MRRPAAALLLLAALLAGCGSGGPGPARERTAASRGIVRLGPADPGRRIGVDLVLPLRQAAIGRYLSALHDPRSPGYRHFIDARAFGRRFGLAPARLRDLRDRAGALGLTVGRGFAQRTQIHASATIRRLSRLLHTRFAWFRDPDGRRFYAPERPATVPPALHGLVADVAGLSDRRPEPADAPAAGLTPLDTARAYDLQPLYDQGIRGDGVTVAVFSVGAYSQSDLQQFDREVAKNPSPGPLPRTVPIGGGPPATDEAVASEDALDVQTIRNVAPNAQIVDYQVCSTGCAANAQSLAGALALVVNQVVQDGQAKIISASYSLCDMPFAVTSGDRLAMTNALQAAAARGVTYLESTGDRGALQCQREDPTIITPNVAFPTDLPLTVAVGGTLLSVGTKGEYIAETAWGDTLSHAGGGGGLNPIEPRQPWQTGPGVQSQYSNGHRQLPDVSGPADPDSGFEIVSGGKPQVAGGTSASTPFWAGIMALTQQYAAKQGAGPLPQMSPLLYQLGSSRQPFPPYHDVIRGNNRFYPATPGWDFATGWGSPDAYNFARDVAAAIKK